MLCALLVFCFIRKSILINDFTLLILWVFWFWIATHSQVYIHLGFKYLRRHLWNSVQLSNFSLKEWSQLILAYPNIFGVLFSQLRFHLWYIYFKFALFCLFNWLNLFYFATKLINLGCHCFLFIDFGIN